MPEDMTFMMGKYAAHLPGQLRYNENHMWCGDVDGKVRFGFSAYAVRLMQDVYFLDWTVDADTKVTQLQQIGHIETSKAVSDLYAPLAGAITAFNRELLKDPTPINVDTYGPGWLFEMDADATGTLDVNGYHEFLTANWDKTQRMIKGKMNIEE